ncbi:ABC1 family protein [Dictyocaulus viviparus]|uniref:ABC1 family protein n=1 Tax=Dictyocaulus viviparus TaxID=29172 RepID=A0A0D8YCZ7_DICVI|nr:ABC1 family protein [Dictyocaulus viviparus]
MSIRPSKSTMRWCYDEIGPIFNGLRLLFRSQLGYEGRRLEGEIYRACLPTTVIGGSIVDSSSLKKPSSSLSKFLETAKDIAQRTDAVAVGIYTLTTLMSKGIFPGEGGYTISVSGEKIFGKRQPFDSGIIAELKKVAELILNGAIALPNVSLPNLHQLGLLSLKNTRLKDFEHVNGRNILEKTTNDTMCNGLTKAEQEFLLNAAKSVGDLEAEEKIFGKSKIYRPVLPADYSIKPIEFSDGLPESNESNVPSTRIGRLASFGKLAVGLAGGAVAEVTRRTFSYGSSQIADGLMKSPFLSSANADRIVQTLCRVRGAALKLGQMLSIQDPDTVPAHLLEIFERVRQSADFMPLRQVTTICFILIHRKFQKFVHRAVLLDGRKVAVKIQYPGVAQGINSDINNLVSVLALGGLFPKGLFLENFIEVARKELAEECDYLREARAMRKFRELLAGSKDFYVPEVVDSLTTNRVITAEYVIGKPVDKCINEPQVVRDYIAGKFIELCLHEIFVWRFMQTDPNWSNFYLGVHPLSGEPRLVLLDFGASRSYNKTFVDRYMKLIKAASDGDTTKIVELSRDIGFLTGYETTVMKNAHVESVLILGETLTSNHPYDFSRQSVTQRIRKLIPVMLEHRLTSPPEEIYSLHRKLSGSYLLATKLKAVVSCGGLFRDIYDNYTFGEDGKDIDLDTLAEESEEFAS